MPVPAQQQPSDPDGPLSTPVITAAPSPAILGEAVRLTVRDVPDGVSAVVVRGGELAGGADHRYHLGEDLSGAGTWTGVVPLARDATVGEARLQVGNSAPRARSGRAWATLVASVATLATGFCLHGWALTILDTVHAHRECRDLYASAADAAARWPPIPVAAYVLSASGFVATLVAYLMIARSVRRLDRQPHSLAVTIATVVCAVLCFLPVLLSTFLLYVALSTIGDVQPDCGG